MSGRSFGSFCVTFDAGKEDTIYAFDKIRNDENLRKKVWWKDFGWKYNGKVGVSAIRIK